MNYKKIFFIGFLLMLVILSVVVVSAEENATDMILENNDESLLTENADDEIYCEKTNDVGENTISHSSDDLLEKPTYTFKPTFYVDENKLKSFDFSYGGYNTVRFTLCWDEYKDGMYSSSVLGDASGEIKFNLNNKGYSGTVSKGEVRIPIDKNIPPGSYKCTLHYSGCSIDYSDEYLNVQPCSKTITINIKYSSKYYFNNGLKFSLNKCKGYSDLYTILSANLKDNKGRFIQGGYVKFIVNGKTYKSKVNDGKAKVVVKLHKAKKYTYKAFFKYGKYTTKTIKSKVAIKKAPSRFTIKVGKYKCKISPKDYNKIQKAKIKGFFTHKYDTGKKINYKEVIKGKSTKTKKKLYIYTWKSGNKYYSESYNSALDTPKGYKYVGQKVVTTSKYSKHYIIYKKTSKNVVTNIKKTNVYLVIESDPYWGATAKVYHLSYKSNSDSIWQVGKSKKIF